ncbi:MAG: DUF1080 domain-containing protein [Oscillospiraceae bacterium]|nr:DUF1080 domain-containing protein [Oscillospiraceae bacterium]
MKKRIVIASVIGAAALALILVFVTLRAPGSGIALRDADWITEAGDWEIKDGIYSTLSDQKDSLLLLGKEIDQENIDLSAEVMFPGTESAAGLVFRESEDNFSKRYTDLMIDTGTGGAVIHNRQSMYGEGYGIPGEYGADVWHQLKVELRGHNAKYYVNGELVSERSDIMVAPGQTRIALLATGSGVRFRGVSAEPVLPARSEWQEILNGAKVEKHGRDRLNARKYEYMYTGLNGTTMLIGPYGFMAPNRKQDGKFIYDYWWEGTVKKTPFKLAGEYVAPDGSTEPGTIAGDGFDQVLDITDGSVSTNLTLTLKDGDIQTSRRTFVSPDGVANFSVSGGAAPFSLGVTPTDYLLGLTFSEIGGCLVATAPLGAETAVIAIAGNGEADADAGRMVFRAGESAYMFVAPACTINEPDAVEQAVRRAKEARDRGFEAQLQNAKSWWDAYYAKSSVSIPDLGMAKWYARALFYNAVAVAGSRVPPGCYATNPDGFFGNVCFEFDIMFSILGLMPANRTEVTQSITDWIYRVQPRLMELASNDYYNYPEGSVKYAGLMGYDGTSVQDPSLEQTWHNDYPGANVVYTALAQANYTGAPLEPALDILWRQTLAQASSQDYFEEIGGYAHDGVWSPIPEDFNHYYPGDFLQNNGLIWLIETCREYGVSRAEWDEMLPDIGLPTVYNPDYGADIYINTAFIPEGLTRNDKSGGPQCMPFFWLKTQEIGAKSFMPTCVSILDGGNLSYFFNRGWLSATVSKAHLADFALDTARMLLDPTQCLYDDTTMIECVAADDRDFRQAPELGALGSYLMAVNDMLFDGYGDVIGVFPSVTEEWLEQGVSFRDMAASGQWLVSASYSERATEVTVTNRSGVAAEKRLLVRIPKGSGGAKVSGGEFISLSGGCFALVTIAAEPGETVSLKVEGQKAAAAPENFEAVFPYNGASGVDSASPAFGWQPSGGAVRYRLTVALDPEFSQIAAEVESDGDPLIRDLTGLSPGTTYYWRVTALNAKGETQTETRTFTAAPAA